MFEAVTGLFKKPFIPTVGDASKPGPDVKHKAWCVIIHDRRVGYIDHYKSDGRFGVRPVDASGRHFPNTSQHWTNEQRLMIPEELSLSLAEIRAATDDELPAEYRQSM